MTEPIYQHLSEAPILQELIPDLRPFPISSTHSVFHDLMSCIIEQQIHYRSSKRIFAKMLQQADLEQLSLDTFPIFEEKALSQRKLSRNKIATIERILHFFRREQPDWQALTDDEVRERLGSIKGVGAWTIDMILLFTLERPDIFPVKDYHLKRIMIKLYELVDDKTLPKEMEAIAADWAPYRSYAVRYLLAWKEANK